MFIFLRRLLKQPLLWSFLIMLAFQYIAFRFLTTTEQMPVLAAVSTGLFAVFGYFATHHLTNSRDQKERKFQQCLELIKKIRFFILETNIKGTTQHAAMRDELQDAYFAFSLLTSEKSYRALSHMMDEFKRLLDEPGRLETFKSAQSDFINCLRKEFFVDKDLNFETYDFNLHSTPPAP